VPNYTKRDFKEAIPLKYWRGYLVAGILAAAAWALTQFAATYADFVDMIYPYMTRLIQDGLATWSSGTQLCLWQLGLLLMAVGVLATAVLMIVFKWNPIQWFGWVLAGISVVFLLNTGVYGLNAYAGDLSEDIRLQVMNPNATQMERQLPISGTRPTSWPNLWSGMRKAIWCIPLWRNWHRRQGQAMRHWSMMSLWPCLPVPGCL
jgi:hypothetical protein